MPFSAQEMFEGIRGKLFLGESPVIIARTMQHVRLIREALVPTISDVTGSSLDSVKVGSGGILRFRNEGSPNSIRGLQGPFYVQVEEDHSGGRWECHTFYRPDMGPPAGPPPPDRFERLDKEIV